MQDVAAGTGVLSKVPWHGDAQLDVPAGGISDSVATAAPGPLTLRLPTLPRYREVVTVQT